MRQFYYRFYKTFRIALGCAGTFAPRLYFGSPQQVTTSKLANTHLSTHAYLVSRPPVPAMSATVRTPAHAQHPPTGGPPWRVPAPHWSALGKRWIIDDFGADLVFRTSSSSSGVRGQSEVIGPGAANRAEEARLRLLRLLWQSGMRSYGRPI